MLIVLTYFILSVIIIYYYYTRRIERLDDTPLKNATEEQIEDANNYAMKRMYLDRGFGFNDIKQEPEHTQESCAKISRYPSTQDGDYLEWRDGKCVYGPESLREFCEQSGLNYDASKGRCIITHSYCQKKGVKFNGTDCVDDTGVSSFLLGNTVTKGIILGTGKIIGRCETPPCKENETCLQGQGDCDTGLYCNAASKCKPKYPNGSYCPGAAAGAYCLSGFCNGFTSTCDELRAAGKPCSGGNACASGKCGKGGVCLDNNGKLPLGTLCTLGVAKHVDQCADGLWCGDAPIKCREKNGIGGYCPLNDVACKDGLFCNGFSKCDSKRRINDTCTTNSACSSGNCIGSLCRPAGEQATIKNVAENNAIAIDKAVFQPVANAAKKLWNSVTSIKI